MYKIEASSQILWLHLHTEGDDCTLPMLLYLMDTVAFPRLQSSTKLLIIYVPIVSL